MRALKLASKWVSIAFVSLPIFMVLLIVNALYQANYGSQKPVWPANVPIQATRVDMGNWDGTKYILCTVDLPARKNHCIIYAYISGAVLADANFHTEVENRAATKDELNYMWFDGQTITLKNGMRLVPDHKLVRARPLNK